jgi:EAL domain-containing protein (putative c-di-GMP-specific phosphodiesterase class I)
VLVENITEPTEAANLAKRFIRALGVELVFNGQPHRIAASIGIVLSTPAHTRPDDLLRDADVAMYRAKGTGGASYALFDPAMQAQLAERAAMERDLRGALDRREFAVHYQPIIDLASGDVVEVEALVRWRHPVRGAVPPDRFIPVAEETGLIVPLGRWVIREACRQLAAWRDDGQTIDNFCVSVNLSSREFQQTDLVDYVRKILAEYALRGDHLEIEITESTAMENADAVVSRLEQLKASGISLSIDDFGAGYSSLGYLHRFPIDKLKIDRSFVARLLESGDNDGTPIVKAILALAEHIGIEVVAEGIERAEQRDLLRTLKCQLGQGYLFSRPTDAASAVAMLRAKSSYAQREK